MTLQLIELAEQADAVLDAQAAAFDELRQLEKNAPAGARPGRRRRRPGSAARIDAAETTIAELKKTYPDGDLSTVTGRAGAGAQARPVRRDDRRRRARGRARQGEGRPEAGVAVAVRGAQQAVGQVEQLLASVDTGESRPRGEGEAGCRGRRRARRPAPRRPLAASQEAQDYITTHRGAVARPRAPASPRRAGTSSSPSRAGGRRPGDGADRGEGGRAHGRGRPRPARMADVEQAESALASPQNQGNYQQDSGFDGAILGGILGDLFGDGGSVVVLVVGSSWGGGSCAAAAAGRAPAGAAAAATTAAAAASSAAAAAAAGTRPAARRRSSGRSGGQRPLLTPPDRIRPIP